MAPSCWVVVVVCGGASGGVVRSFDLWEAINPDKTKAQATNDVPFDVNDVEPPCTARATTNNIISYPHSTCPKDPDSI